MSQYTDADTDPVDEELQELIEPARQGRPEARNRLAELLRPRLRIFAHALFPQIVGRRADASDVTQDSLLEIDQSIGEFRGSTARELWAWARWKVRAQLKDVYEKHVEAHIRSVTKEVSPSDADFAFIHEAANDSSPSSVAIRKEEFLLKIEQLPYDEKLIMALLYVDHRTPDATASILSKSVEDVEKTRFRALRLMTKMVNVKGSPE